MQGQLSWFLWKLFGYHLVHFLTQSGSTQRQPASFTIQAYYIKINQLRTAPSVPHSRQHKWTWAFQRFLTAPSFAADSRCFLRSREPRACVSTTSKLWDGQGQTWALNGPRLLMTVMLNIKLNEVIHFGGSFGPSTTQRAQRGHRDKDAVHLCFTPRGQAHSCAFRLP